MIRDCVCGIVFLLVNTVKKGYDTMTKNEMSNEVPIQNRVLLTFSQAAKYSSIGENKLRELAERTEFSNCILRNGNRKLIKRENLQDYLLDLDEI